MEKTNTTFLYNCTECKSTGFILARSEEDIFDMIYCPCCGETISADEMEVNMLVEDELIEDVDDSINDFIQLKN